MYTLTWFLKVPTSRKLQTSYYNIFNADFVFMYWWGEIYIMYPPLSFFLSLYIFTVKSLIRKPLLYIDCTINVWKWKGFVQVVSKNLRFLLPVYYERIIYRKFCKYDTDFLYAWFLKRIRGVSFGRFFITLLNEIAHYSATNIHVYRIPLQKQPLYWLLNLH